MLLFNVACRGYLYLDIASGHGAVLGHVHVLSPSPPTSVAVLTLAHAPMTHAAESAAVLCLSADPGTAAPCPLTGKKGERERKMSGVTCALTRALAVGEGGVSAVLSPSESV